MKLSRSDAGVSAAVLLGAAALVYLFVADLNAVSSRSGEKELGSVVFKKLTATRKASSTFAWERIRNNSPVYNEDTLRTADSSEATILFDDGTSLDMLENSMLKIDFHDKTRNLEFLSGEIGVGSSKKAASYTISSAAGTINVDTGAQAVFTRDADKLSVEVTQGTATIVKADGSTQTIAQDQELQVDVKSGEAAIVSRPIVPIAPERNGRLLAFTDGDKATVEFAWQPEAETDAARSAAHAGARNASYSLEISQTKDFQNTSVTKITEEKASSVDLEAGVWYWRVRDAEGNESPGRRFSLNLAEAPQPVFPQDGRRYEFRSLKPEITFAWTPMEGASAYLFEVSSESSFANPIIRSRAMTTNYAVNSLGEGVWYWRVTPMHTFTPVGAESKIRMGTFTIARRAEMGTPALTAPLDGSLYPIQDIEGKGLDFSWVPESEAVSYELIVSKAADLSSPILRVTAAQPYLHLAGAQAEALKRPLAYFWGIRWIDKEGNASPLSAGRKLQGVDGSIAVRLSSPPDGYRIADSLIQNTRFAWKSNVASRTDFQLSRDAEFQDLVHQETVNADTLIGRQWGNGRYFWRLCAYNADGTIFLKTEPRSIEVVEPFTGPTLVTPIRGGVIYLHEQDSTTFAWTPVANADYYNLTLRSAADDYRTVLFQKNFQEKPKLAFALGKLSGGDYRLSIQAFAASGDKTTRIIGYIGENDFTFKPVSYIKLQSPGDGGHVEGLEARAGRTVFAYSLEDEPTAAEIVVSTDPIGANVVSHTPARGGSANAGRLDAGVYYWTVAGSLSGLDVSSKERFRFEVDPPPPPPAPTLAAPLDGTLYRIQDLDGGSLDLSWIAQADAASYELVVSKEKDLSSPLAKITTEEPRLRLTGSRVPQLKRPGSYYWGVRWTNKERDVSLLSPGRRLQGVDRDAAVRPVFPPDGYRLCGSLLKSTHFAWESDFDTQTVFQLARDQGFLHPVYEATSEGGATIDQDCVSGRYYWRLQTRNADGSTFMETPSRSVDIVDPFPAPNIVVPVTGAGFTLREGDSATFAWKAVEGADRYDLALRSAADDYSAVVLRLDSIEGTNVECRLGNLPSGSYRLSLQAVAAQGEKTSRIEGRTTERDFRYKRLSYGKLASPANGAHVDGLEARRGKTVFAYEAVDTPDTAEIIVSTDAEGSAVTARKADRSGRADVGRLTPGVYYWTVRGTFSGFDISARGRFRFVVDPPPLLAAPEILQPARDSVFGAAELRNKRNIFFSWKAVEGASYYRLAIYAQGKTEPIFVKDQLTSTSFTVDDLTVLDKGLLRLTVEARSFDERGEIEQTGREGSSVFTIDLPPVKRINAETGVKVYGL